MLSSSVVHLTAESFDDEIKASGVLLLDCWAEWCAPCRALSPILAKLADEYNGELRVAKVNVDEHTELSRRLAVRNLPTLVLFRDGQELARRSGLLTLPQLREWLARADVHTTTAPGGNDETAGAPSSAGAFHGDTELQSFLVQRLLRHAAAGEVTVSRFPYWHEGKGTVTGALVHSQDGQVFARMTGLPLSFGYALHFVDIRAEAEVEEVFNSICPGSNLENIAPMLVAAWLDDGNINWPQLLEQDPAMLSLREQWLRLFRAQLTGENVEQSQWHALRQLVVEQDYKENPRLTTQCVFADMMAELSPPPDQDDEAAWNNIFLLRGVHLNFAVLQSAQGWSGEDIAMDAMRFHWFKQRVGLDAEGNPEQEQLRQLREQWEGDHADWMRLNDSFISQFETLRAPYKTRLRSHLIELLKKAPRA